MAKPCRAPLMGKALAGAAERRRTETYVSTRAAYSANGRDTQGRKSAMDTGIGAQRNRKLA